MTRELLGCLLPSLVAALFAWVVWAMRCQRDHERTRATAAEEALRFERAGHVRTAADRDRYCRAADAAEAHVATLLAERERERTAADEGRCEGCGADGPGECAHCRAERRAAARD